MRKYLGTLAVVAVLAGCGGGDDTPAAQPPWYDGIKPASVIGFLRVFVGQGAQIPRQALEAFVADQHQTTDVQYRDTAVGQDSGVEATVGDRTVVVTVGGLDEEEHRNMSRPTCSPSRVWSGSRLARVRIARVAHPDGMAFVALEGEGEDLVAAEIAEHPFGSPTFTGRRWPLADSRLLAPILPSKVVCVGKNYADHAREMGGEAPADPVIFLKPSTSVIGPGSPIKLPASSSRVDYEGELAVVIGTPCRDVPAARAKDVILGYTVANDVTARDQQRADGQWTRAKGYDTFCPLGPWIDTAVTPDDLALRTELDGAVKQDSRTSLLLHDIPKLVEWISRVMTLLPGDVIITGTPAGVGPMTPGQTVSVTVDGIGTLTNPVTAR